MAVSTFYLAVISFQGISGGAVIEISHPVSAIVASKAVCPVIFHVDSSKVFLMLRMTVKASSIFDGFIRSALMALSAFHRAGVVIDLVPI